ncbi:MAG: hypothetical protein HZB26_18695 [Candidatus Hydrogenedentes bacterium]|nr:hypothetical protein [Candidatus Hydrogenedentota bacterium]
MADNPNPEERAGEGLGVVAPPHARLKTKAVLVLTYAAVILLVDTLAAFAASGRPIRGVPIPHFFVVFRWQFPNGFDLFKFLFWFLIPFLWSLPSLDWRYFGLGRWKRVDRILFPVFLAVGLLSLTLIPHIPSLRSTYHGMGYLSATQKWQYAQIQLLWTLSWLLGWEFLHRYALLRSVAAAWPRFGWLLVPLAEGLYHLQKPPLEALGMVVFSVLACRWTMSRKNILLPFGVHLAIELGLVAYLLVAL